MNIQHKEIEVRFLEINKESLIKKLGELKAEDRGEDLLEEVIFYDKNLTWRDSGHKFVRLRKNSKGIFLAYKHHKLKTFDGTEEIEFSVSSMDKAEAFLSRIGLVAYRHQQKKRHSFSLAGVIVEIDSWPKIPAYVELEGQSEEDLKQAAKQLGLDWKNAVFASARAVIENYYHIPVGKMTWFTFNKFE